jgi:uncharacterized protein YegL
MKQGLTEIIAVVDKSGSMLSVKSDAIGGFNAFLEGQKKLPGEATMTVVLFDSRGRYELKYSGVPLAEVEPFNEGTYVPGGMTALLDAIGKTIDAVGKRLSMALEAERPEKVIMAILTDGHENDSKEYKRPQIMDKINHQRDVYKWEFIFLGANQDAIEEGGRIGIHHAMTYAATPEGTRDAYNLVGNMVASYRTTGKVEPEGDKKRKKTG